MNYSAVATTYARALMSPDLKEDEMRRRMDDLRLALEALAKVEKHNRFFSSPQITIEEKQKVLNKSLHGIDPFVLNFLSLLIGKNRFGSLKVIVDECQKLVDGRLNILKGTLSTAVPLKAEDLRLITEKLSKKYHKNVELATTTDPRLIAGGVLTIGNEQIDFSAKGKLDRLKSDLMELSLDKKEHS